MNRSSPPHSHRDAFVQTTPVCPPGTFREARSPQIDLAKFVACCMVVVLHAFGNEPIHPDIDVYLFGSFGIPLFFFVNGWLLSTRDFTFGYVRRKIGACMALYLRWTILYGTMKAVATCNVWSGVKMLWGPFVGKTELYHLWFLPALCIVYLILWGANALSLRLFSERIQYSLKPVFVLPAILFLVFGFFLYSMHLKSAIGLELRNIVPATFRLPTNMGYFALGLWAALAPARFRNLCVSLLLSGLALAYGGICWCSPRLGLYWASSFYDSPFVAMGVLCIFLLCLKTKMNNPAVARITGLLSVASTGIWLFHPLVIKILRMLAIRLDWICLDSFLGKTSVFVLALLISFLLTICFSKTVLGKKLVQV